jgi:DHA2 family multidrug resistance protein-like MFS transporter
MAPFAGRLADRYPAGILGSIGLAIVGVGFVLLATLPAHPTPLVYCGGLPYAAVGWDYSSSPTPARS